MEELLESIEVYLGDEIIKANNKKCVSICSAGMDSTTAACVMKYFGFDITLMHFDYGNRAAEAENFYIKKIADKLEVNLELVNSSYIGKLGGSPLTNSEIYLPKGRDSVQSSQCWVPARNVVFIAYALAYCDRYNIPFITMGINKTESNYPDHTDNFINSFNKLAIYGAMNPARLIAPCFSFIKKEEILLMKKIGYFNILNHTWSCDISLRNKENQFIMCGECGCCHSSKKAFLEAEVEDPRKHASYFIEDLKPYDTEEDNGKES